MDFVGSMYHVQKIVKYWHLNLNLQLFTMDYH